MQVVVQKLLDKSPFRYDLGRNQRWLVPIVFIKKDCKEANKTQLKNYLTLLVDAKRFPSMVVDGVVQ
jgi:hypothetical protein